jgi:hypothetical protein
VTLGDGSTETVAVSGNGFALAGLIAARRNRA